MISQYSNNENASSLCAYPINLLTEEINRLKSKIPPSYDMIAKILVLGRPIIDVIFIEMGYPNIEDSHQHLGRPKTSTITLILIHLIAQLKNIASYRQVESEINNQIYWKTVLQIKKCPHHSTLSKFRKTFSSSKIHEIFSKIIALLHIYGILKDDKSSIIDSAPINGNQNFVRSNTLCKINEQKLGKLISHIDLSPALQLIIPPLSRRGRATKYPPEVLIRFFLYEKLCGFLSRNQAVSYLKKNPHIAKILGFPQDSIPNPDYFSNLIRHLPPISLLLQELVPQVTDFFDQQPSFNQNDPLHFFFRDIETEQQIER